MRKSGISAIMAFLLLFTAIGTASAENLPATAGTGFKDVPFTHWAATSIQRWKEASVLQGYHDGSFQPDRTVTRAEFAVMINRIFGFQTSGEAKFNDIPDGNWAFGEMSKALEAGYFQLDSNGNAKPGAELTRAEAAVALQALFQFEETAETPPFSDTGKLDSAKVRAITAMAFKGYLKGYPDGTFGPDRKITRAEVSSLLDRMIGLLAQGESTADTVKGNVIVNRPGVLLKDTVIDGNLYLTEGIGSGEATLERVTVKGKTYIRGGGEHSVILTDAHLNEAQVDKKDDKVRILASGTTSVGDLLLRSGAIIEGQFGKVTVFAGPNGSTLPVIQIRGTVDQLSIDQPAIIELADTAVVKSLTVSPSASGSSIEGKGKIEKVENQAPELKYNGKDMAIGSTTGEADTSAPPSPGTPPVTPQPPRIPSLEGKIIYHSYSDYFAWDSKLYMLDLSDNSLVCLSDYWNVDHAMNASFSPDGTKIVFMGDDADGTKDWDIFLYDFMKPDQQPVNLTGARGVRDEDPKFSPDGTKIIYKEGHWDSQRDDFAYDLKEMDLTGEILRTVTDPSNTVEESMPYYTADGQSILYAAGARAGSDIYRIQADGSENVPVVNLTYLQEYYPIAREDGSFLYSRWVSNSDHHDQIYLERAGEEGKPLAFNEPTSDYSDGFPVGLTDYVLLSSTRPGGRGGYDVYIADMTKGNIWSLTQYNPAINSNRDELGAAYTSNKDKFPLPKAPKPISKTNAPALQGKVVYYSYLDDPSQSNLYMLDLSRNSLTQLNSAWNITNISSVSITPDGRKITFEGVDPDGGTATDIFLYDLANAEQPPVNLTAARDNRETEPSFSPDGTKIVYKERRWDNGINDFTFDLLEMDLNDESHPVRQITNDPSEESTPRYSPDGSKIYYMKGARVTAAVYSINTDGTGDSMVVDAPDVYESLPAVDEEGTVSYTRWLSSTDHSLQVFQVKPGQAESSEPYNETGFNFSYAYPINADYSIVSSTLPGRKGGYDLYVADRRTGEMWPLDLYNPSVNTTFDEIGAVYSGS